MTFNAIVRSSGVSTSQSTTASEEAKDFKVVVTLTDPPKHPSGPVSTIFDQPLTSLDFGLPVQEVRALVRSSLAKPREIQEALVTSATNRRGRTIRCRIVASVSVLGGDAPNVVLLMEELRPD